MVVAGSNNAQDQVARDDAHLRSLGIKPELQRTLGFISNFAVAFSYISVSTGTFTLIAVGLAVGGPAFFWSWPLIILGQTFVALNFAELSSHFPVAGSIYQWSKRLANRTLGWFTGWTYFWAGVLTTTAVAITVPLVLSSIFGFDLAAASPIPALSNAIFWSIITLITTTAINAFGVRLLAMINNMGVAAEILGLVVFALILLIFYNHQSPAVLFETAPDVTSDGGMVPTSAWRCSWPVRRLRLRHGRDLRRGDRGCGSPSAARRSVGHLASGAVGFIFLLAHPVVPDVPAQIVSAQEFAWAVGGADPIGDTILTRRRGSTWAGSTCS